jgi:hypothetical protein
MAVLTWMKIQGEKRSFMWNIAQNFAFIMANKIQGWGKTISQ